MIIAGKPELGLQKHQQEAYRAVLKDILKTCS